MERSAWWWTFQRASTTSCLKLARTLVWLCLVFFKLPSLLTRIFATFHGSRFFLPICDLEMPFWCIEFSSHQMLTGAYLLCINDFINAYYIIRRMREYFLSICTSDKYVFIQTTTLGWSSDASQTRSAFVNCNHIDSDSLTNTRLHVYIPSRLVRLVTVSFHSVIPQFRSSWHGLSPLVKALFIRNYYIYLSSMCYSKISDILNHPRWAKFQEYA